jgi:hypothetical protein
MSTEESSFTLIQEIHVDGALSLTLGRIYLLRLIA